MVNRWSSRVVQEIHSEEGHTAPALAAMLGAAGAIVLGIGAANDTGWLAVAGGIGAGVGMLAMMVTQHQRVDYDIFDRLEKLEKQQRSGE